MSKPLPVGTAHDGTEPSVRTFEQRNAIRKDEENRKSLRHTGSKDRAFIEKTDEGRTPRDMNDK